MEAATWFRRSLLSFVILVVGFATCVLSSEEYECRLPKDTNNATIHLQVERTTPRVTANIPNLQPSSVSGICVDHLNYLLENSQEFREQYNNIYLRLQPHLDRLSNVWRGSFRNCLGLNEALTKRSAGGHDIQGQFCLAFFLPPSGSRMTLEERLLLDGQRPPTSRPITIPQTGVCMPSTCAPADIENVLKSILGDSASNWTITVPQTYCQTELRAPLPVFTKIFLLFVGLLLALTFAGTMIEMCGSRRQGYRPIIDKKENRNGNFEKFQSDPGKKTAPSSSILKNGKLIPQSQSPLFSRWFIRTISSTFQYVRKASSITQSPTRNVLKCFSLYSNVKTLFKTQTSPNEIECFNGIRFYVMIGVQVTHVLHQSFPNGWRNLSHGAEGMKSFHYQGTLHLGVYLESSVAISAGLLTMAALRRIREEKQNFNVLYFYARRLWRLIPAYFINLALIVTLLPYIGEGPRWPDLMYEVQNCRKNGWTNILFINNFINSDRMCQLQYWYSAADIQLLLIAPILILAYHRSVRYGMKLTFLCISLSVGWLGYKSYFHRINGRDLHFELSPMNSVKYLCELYYLPLSRLGCYAMGITSGYCAYVKGRNIRINPALQYVLSTLAITILFSPCWHWYRFETDRLRPPSRIEAACLEAFCRIVYSTGGSYLCLASYARFQDPIMKSFNWLMTLKFQTVTARLHYSVYILHFNVNLIFLATRLEPMEYSSLQLVKVVMGLLFVTYVVAIPYTLLAEMPFINLAKLVENRRTAEKSIIQAPKEDDLSKTANHNGCFDNDYFLMTKKHHKTERRRLTQPFKK